MKLVNVFLKSLEKTVTHPSRDYQQTKALALTMLSSQEYLKSQIKSYLETGRNLPALDLRTDYVYCIVSNKKFNIGNSR
jgi:hypothetical protein